jgi:hypothetical protein
MRVVCGNGHRSHPARFEGGRRVTDMARPRERTGGCLLPGAGRLAVSLVPGCGWCAGLEDGSQGGALGVGEGWGVGDEVLNVRGEGVRVRDC